MGELRMLLMIVGASIILAPLDIANLCFEVLPHETWLPFLRDCFRELLCRGY